MIYPLIEPVWFECNPEIAIAPFEPNLKGERCGPMLLNTCSKWFDIEELCAWSGSKFITFENSVGSASGRRPDARSEDILGGRRKLPTVIEKICDYVGFLVLVT